jgi:hypothetical protein
MNIYSITKFKKKEIKRKTVREREEGEGARIDGRRRGLAAHREGERQQHLGGNRRGATGSGVRGR